MPLAETMLPLMTAHPLTGILTLQSTDACSVGRRSRRYAQITVEKQFTVSLLFQPCIVVLGSHAKSYIGHRPVVSVTSRVHRISQALD